MSPVWHLNERDRLSAAVARRIWLAHGGRSWAEARNEGSLLLLEAMVSRHLNDAIIRASLALGYLEVLAKNLDRADYEDARDLVQEIQWVEAYLHKRVWPSLAEVDGLDLWTVPGAHVGKRREQIHKVLLRLTLAELQSAGVAPPITSPR